MHGLKKKRIAKSSTKVPSSISKGMKDIIE